MREMLASSLPVQELLRHLQLASQLDLADPITDWQRVFDKTVTQAVTFLDCPYCCQPRAAHVFADGQCVCEGCPEGWEHHDLFDVLSYVGVPIVSKRLVVPGVPATWIRWRNLKALNSAMLFAYCAYPGDRAPYGLRRHVG